MLDLKSPRHTSTRLIRVAPTGSKASPNVRYAFNGYSIRASRFN